MKYILIDNPVINTTITTTNYQITKLPKMSSLITDDKGFESFESFCVMSRNEGVPNVPPVHTSPTSFKVERQSLALEDIKDIIVKALDDKFNECISLRFYPNMANMGNIAYLKGSIRCKAEVMMIYDKDKGDFLVEVNRLLGDSFIFASIYRAIYDGFHNHSIQPMIMKIVKPDESLFSSKLDFEQQNIDMNEDEKNALDVLLTLGSSDSLDEKLNVSQTLSWIFSTPTSTESICRYSNFIPRIVRTLIELTKVEFDGCNQHAWYALSSLSSTPECVKVMDELAHTEPGLFSIFVKSLFELCVDEPEPVNATNTDCITNTNSIPMRRVCTRLLANIACSEDKTFVDMFLSSIDQGVIVSWLDNVELLKDPYIQTHASTAKIALKSLVKI